MLDLFLFLVVTLWMFMSVFNWDDDIIADMYGDSVEGILMRNFAYALTYEI